MASPRSIWARLHEANDANWRIWAAFPVANLLFVCGDLLEEAGSADKKPEVYFFSLDTNNWDQLPVVPSGDAFSCTDYIASATLPGSANTFFFYPMANSTNLFASYLNADPARPTWVAEIPISGQNLDLRTGYSASAITDSSFILFGGIDSNGQNVNNIYVVQPGSSAETPLVCRLQACTGDIPSPRSYHSATVLPSTSSLIVFGGQSSTGQSLNDLYILDTNKWHWTCLHSGKASSSVDALPSPRQQHTLSYLERSNSLVLFGGIDASNKASKVVLSDTWAFDMNQNAWKSVSAAPCNGQPAQVPTGRFNHFAAFSSVSLTPASSAITSFSAVDNTLPLLVLFGGSAFSSSGAELRHFDVFGARVDMGPPSPKLAQAPVPAPVISAPSSPLQSVPAPVVAAAPTPVVAEPTVPIVAASSSVPSSPIAVVPQQQQPPVPAAASSPASAPAAAQVSEPEIIPSSASAPVSSLPLVVEPSLPSPSPAAAAAVGSSSLPSASLALLPSQPSPQIQAPSPVVAAASSPVVDVPVTIRVDFSGHVFGAANNNNPQEDDQELADAVNLYLSQQQEQQQSNSPLLASSAAPASASSSAPSFTTIRVADISQPALEALQICFEQHIDARFSPPFLPLCTLLRIIRQSHILDNGTTWRDILDCITVMTALAEVQEQSPSDCFTASIQTPYLELRPLAGDEKIYFEEFIQIMNGVAQIKYSAYYPHQQSVCLDLLLQESIVPFGLNPLTSDPSLDQLLQPRVLALFDKHSASLRELYHVFCTMNILTAYAPTWDDLIRHNTAITLAEFLKLTECFEIAPALVPRHIICSKIVTPSCISSIPSELPLEGLQVSSQPDGPLGLGASADTGSQLTFPEFLEALGRMAIMIFSRFPYSQTLHSTCDQLEALFEKLGFGEPGRRRFVSALKRAGVAYSNRKAGPKSSSTISPHAQPEGSDELIAVLRNRERLQDELDRIFIYYCSYGDQLTTDLLSNSKFGKFVRDVRLAGYVSSLDADVIFAKFSRVAAVQQSASPSRSSAAKQIPLSELRMRFDQFMECIAELALRRYRAGGSSTGQQPGAADEESLTRFLAHHVLPFAHRLPPQFTQVNLSDPAALELCEQHRIALTMVFTVFAAGEEDARVETINVNEFQKFASEMDIMPSLVSRSDLFKILRTANVNIDRQDSNLNELSYDDFVQCVIRCAAIGYSRHPYTLKYPTLAEKVQALFERCGFVDVGKLRKKLEKCNHWVAPSLSVAPGPSASSSSSSSPSAALSFSAISSPRKGATPSAQFAASASSSSAAASTPSSSVALRRLSELPAEAELHERLEDIFKYYASFADRASTEKMGHNAFKRFIADCDLVTEKFNTAALDIIFSSCTRNSNTPMEYDVFCDALALIAKRKFTNLSPADALKELLLAHILPLASSLSKDRVNSKDASSQSGIDFLKPLFPVLKRYLNQFSQIFDKYRTLDAVAPTKNTWGEIKHQNDTMSVAEFIRFAQDFGFCPDLVTVNDLMNCFRAANTGSNHDDDADAMDFNEFLECFARCAFKAFSDPAFNGQLPTLQSKLQAFIARMNIDDMLKLNLRLSQVKSFSSRKN